MDLHLAESDMNRSAAHFDSDNRVQDTDSSLKWPQEPVLIREHTILPRLDTKADASMDVLRRGFKPCVALRLLKKHQRGTTVLG